MKLKNLNFKIVVLILLSLLFVQSCTTRYYVTKKGEPSTVPPSVNRAKFQVSKKGPLRRLLFFLPPIPATDLRNPRYKYKNFSRQEDNKYIATEAQLNIKPDSLGFMINTVLLLDNSMSMGNNLSKLKEQARKLIDMKSKNENYAIAIFSGGDNFTLLCTFSDDIVKLKDAINTITLGDNSTNLNGAIGNSLDLLSDIKSKTNDELMVAYRIIVFTDGADTQGRITEQQILQKNKNDFDIIPVVVKSPEIDLKALKKISTETGLFNIKKVYKASSFDKLGSVFDKIQRNWEDYSKSHYYLEYMSPKRTGTHNFVITVEPRFSLFKAMNRLGDNILSYNNEVSSSFDASLFYNVKQGICVTSISSDKNQSFIESKDIWNTNIVKCTSGKSLELQIFSVGGMKPYGSYTYALNNNNFSYILITNDLIKIVPKGSGETILTITDNFNGFSKKIILQIN